MTGKVKMYTDTSKTIVDSRIGIVKLFSLVGNVLTNSNVLGKINPNVDNGTTNEILDIFKVR